MCDVYWLGGGVRIVRDAKPSPENSCSPVVLVVMAKSSHPPLFEPDATKILGERCWPNAAFLPTTKNDLKIAQDLGLSFLK